MGHVCVCASSLHGTATYHGLWEIELGPQNGQIQGSRAPPRLRPPQLHLVGHAQLHALTKGNKGESESVIRKEKKKLPRKVTFVVAVPSLPRLCPLELPVIRKRDLILHYLGLQILWGHVLVPCKCTASFAAYIKTLTYRQILKEFSRKAGLEEGVVVLLQVGGRDGDKDVAGEETLAALGHHSCL